MTLPLCAAVPLYQEYCLQEVRGYLQRITKSPVSELLSPQYVQELQGRISSGLHSEAALPPPEPLEPTPTPAPHLLPLARPIPTVTPGTLWQDLEEVKASGILGTMTPQEVHQQEVGFVFFSFPSFALLKSHHTVCDWGGEMSVGVCLRRAQNV